MNNRKNFGLYIYISPVDQVVEETANRVVINHNYPKNSALLMIQSCVGGTDFLWKKSKIGR